MMAAPKIRFKGFAEDWVQRKLGEVAELNPRSVLPASFEYVDLESVVGTSLIAHRTENKETAPSRAQRLAKKGDVFYQTVRPYQKNNLLFDMDSDNFVFSTGYAQLRPHIDSYFLFCKLQEEKFVAEVLDNCTGTSYPAINSTDLSQIEVDIALVKTEQTAIGNFFRTLDDTITLHKRKLDGLKELKKGYLQQMFPQAGECVPRVRFAGFSGDWEMRKLGGVFEQTAKFVNPKEDDIELWSLTVENGLTPKTERYNREFLVKKDDSYKSVAPYEFVYNPMNMTLGAVDLNLLNKNVAVSGYYITMRANEDYDNNYFAIWLKSASAIELYKIYATGGLIEKQRVQFPTLSQIMTLVPSKAEQTAIGSFFRSLDEQIVTQQTKLDKLKQLKAAYLQNMFV